MRTLKLVPLASISFAILMVGRASTAQVVVSDVGPAQGTYSSARPAWISMNGGIRVEAPYGVASPAFSTSTPTFYYSYAVSAPDPARAYVPYGQSDGFSYHGRAYGHPYDAWTWQYLGDSGGGLAHYYYPPVR